MHGYGHITATTHSYPSYIHHNKQSTTSKVQRQAKHKEHDQAENKQEGLSSKDQVHDQAENKQERVNKAERAQAHAERE